MKLFSSIGLTGIPAVIFTAGILFLSSCVNDIDKVQSVSQDPNSPDEATKDLVIIYSDSGYAQIKLYAAIAESYHQPEDVTKFKDGIKVDFYENQKEITSTLTALYGEINHQTGEVFVRDSVILKNFEKKQYLETEELFWNQKDSTIYTDKYVLVKTKEDGVIGQGQGIKASQTFDHYTILKPVGKLELSDQ